MGTFDVVEALSKLPLLNYVGAVDLADRLSFIASCILLIAGSLIVTLREYMMDPITCYMATNPGGENLLKYVENYCWTEGTMSITNHNAIPQTELEWEKYHDSRIVYYQWVPFVLLIQCGMFHLPSIFWRFMCAHVMGIDLNDFLCQPIVQVEVIPKTRSPPSQHKSDANHEDKMGSDTDSKVTGIVCSFSNMSLSLLKLFIQHRDCSCDSRLHRIKQKLYSRVPMLPSKRFNSWVTFYYFFSKLLYIVNSIGQIFLMQSFLQLNRDVPGAHIGDKYSASFGWEILRDLVTGRRWTQTGAFPRTAYCMVRITGGVTGVRNTLVAQCVLTANMFIEKIYVFFWFWVVMVSIVTIASFINWISRMLFSSRRKSTINKYLQLQGVIEDTGRVNQFCEGFLGLDGLFLVHMLALSRGDVVAGPVVGDLYRMWCSIGDSLDAGSGSNSSSKIKKMTAWWRTNRTDNMDEEAWIQLLVRS